MFLTLKTPRNLAVSLFCLALLCAGHPLQVSAAEVIWNGNTETITQIPNGNTTIPALAPPADSPNGNTVRVEDQTPIVGNVVGGYSNHLDDTAAESSGNTVFVGADTLIANVSTAQSCGVYGGLAYSQTGLAVSSDNTVTVNGTVEGYISGGYAASNSTEARAMRNTVIIGEGANTGNLVYGGYARANNGTAIASDNILRIDGGNLSATVYGAYASTNNTRSTDLIEADNNTTFINGGTLNGVNFYGAFAFAYGHGRVVNNSVFVTGGTINSQLYGAFAQGNNVLAEALENSVTITGGTITSTVYGGCAHTVHGAALAQGNRISMSGGDVRRSLYGGYSSKASNEILETPEVLTTGNTVALSGGAVAQNAVGGGAIRYYMTVDNTGTISATNNSVAVSGGTVSGSVLGGLAQSLNYNVNPSGSNTSIVTNNSVSISGGTILGTISGGLAYHEDSSSPLLPSTATVTNNTVTISGSPTFGENTALYGGYGTGQASGDFYTGNTLNVHDYHGTDTVADVANFQNFSFLVPSSPPSGSAYLQTAALDLGDSPQLLGVSVTNGNALPDGYSVDLIRSEAEKTGGDITENMVIRQGLIMEYDAVVTTTDHALNLTLNNPRAADGTQAVSGGWAGAIALTAQGADFVAFNGIAAANAAIGGIEGYATFATMRVGDFRYHTGSHLDVKGVSLLVGVAGKARVADGTLILGPAFEAGYADFNGQNSGAGYGAIDGRGHGRSFGGALLARYQHDTGAYLDASLRAGTVDIDYNSGLRDDNGRAVTYDARSPYYGLHVKPGFQWPVTEKATLDISAAYLWTRVEGSKETLSSGDRVSFESADSRRLRGGARLEYEVAESLAPYIGVAYEYEFDGDAQAGAYGHAFKTLSFEGASGIGEVGLTFDAAPLFVDLGMQGYTGVREGIGGSLTVRFEF